MKTQIKKQRKLSSTQKSLILIKEILKQGNDEDVIRVLKANFKKQVVSIEHKSDISYPVMEVINDILMNGEGKKLKDVLISSFGDQGTGLKVSKQYEIKELKYRLKSITDIVEGTLKTEIIDGAECPINPKDVDRMKINIISNFLS